MSTFGDINDMMARKLAEQFGAFYANFHGISFFLEESENIIEVVVVGALEISENV